jgi:2-oxoisovalerate dehydrogenase E1 component
VPRSGLARACELLRIMLIARWVDRVEMELVNRGEGFFHVGGAGHEATATLAAHLTQDDWLHLHYRDKAFMLARGIPVSQFFHSLLCTAESHSDGRQMSAHLSSPELKILSLVGPVGNNALQAVGVAHELRHQVAVGLRPVADQPPIVICAMGDGTTQQGEVLEAIAEAVRARLPVLFLIEDNRLAISTSTPGTTFYDRPDGPASEFYGIPIHRYDGRDALGCDEALGALVAQVRRGRGPALAILEVERLTHHTNADDERMYRAESEITEVRAQADPIEILRDRLAVSGMTQAELDGIDRAAEAEVRAAAEAALASPNPTANFDARAPMAEVAPVENTRNGEASEGARPLTMLESMREVLRARLGSDSRITLFGQDIEDPKGDVFGLTRGLTRMYPRQIKNSALTESTIVGVSIGRALAGGRPVAFIQFADFLPLAFNQIASELGSLYWRTAGGWPAPVIILAPCGGYRPGLGPFHAQTFESLFAHVPGLDVVMPSSAADAAGLLNAAFDSARPTLFLYPKVLLNDANVATTEAPANLRKALGRANRLLEGSDLTLVTWGATVALCQRAAAALVSVDVRCDLIDLRSLSPWDRDAVMESARKTRRIIVVHEDNRTCGFGAEVLAAVLEAAGVPVEGRRVTRPDTYVPCNYTNQLDVLPSLKSVLEAAAAMLGLDLGWRDLGAGNENKFVLQAVGSSPADQNVTVLEWKVREGDAIKLGSMLAECEADKATFELRAPVAGRITQLIPEGEGVKVGDPIALILTDGAQQTVRRVPKEPEPIIRKRATAKPAPAARATAPVDATPIAGLSGVSFVTGAHRVSNEEVASWFPGRTAADIQQRTGIEQRYFCADDESALTLAVAAAKVALTEAGLTIADLDGIYVSTSTPLSISPSLACLLHYELCRSFGISNDIPAVDLLAACSGWLYALQAAFDLCHHTPSARVLVVTTEAMSRFLNRQDFDTAIVFGDAATATIVSGADHLDGCSLKLRRPVLSARGEDGSILSLGRITGGVCTPVSMDGLKVFPIAVRKMPAMLEMACAEAGITAKDLDWIIPHQANGRIIAAAQRHAGLQLERIVNNVARYGNTSSCSIPIALAEMLKEGRSGRIGLCAFGGGFTFGAAVIDAETPA